MKKKFDLLSFVLNILVKVAALLTITVILCLVGYILIKGIPHLKPSLFAWNYTSENVSCIPAFINTLIITVLSLLLAAPIGIFSAVYLSEYARRGNRLVKLIRIASEVLAGIPSIVYGLFGFIFFVVALKWGMSLISGTCTLTIMILPLIMRTTEEALLSVPDSYREGSFGLGAGRLRTVISIVLPAAIPGILAGIILAVGRIVGETAALIFTAGTLAKIPNNLLESTRTLSVHMWNLSSEGLYIDQAYATAVVLLVLVLIINALSSWLAKRMSGGYHGEN